MIDNARYSLRAHAWDAYPVLAKLGQKTHKRPNQLIAAATRDLFTGSSSLNRYAAHYPAAGPGVSIKRTDWFIELPSLNWT